MAVEAGKSIPVHSAQWQVSLWTFSRANDVKSLESVLEEHLSATVPSVAASLFPLPYSLGEEDKEVKSQTEWNAVDGGLTDEGEGCLGVQVAKEVFLAQLFAFVLGSSGGYGSETLRVRLLGLVQEHCDFFAPGFAEFLVGRLRVLIMRPGEGHLRSQGLVTLTCVLVELMNTTCGVTDEVRSVVQDSVGVLLQMIRETGAPEDRLLRATACQCLTEVEHASPRILCHALGHLLGLSRAESTMASSRYTNLLLTVLSNELQLHHSNTSSVSQSLVITWETVTGCLGSMSNTCDDFVGSDLEANVLRCVSVVIDTSSEHSPFGLVFALQQLAVIVPAVNLPQSLFRHHFFSLLFAHHPLLVHLVLLFAHTFPDAFESPEDVKLLLLRLRVALSDVHISFAVRHLFATWLAEFSGHLSDPSRCVLRHMVPLLLPKFHDPLELRESRLRVLAAIFATSPVECHAPNSLLNVLTCVEDYRFGPTRSGSLVAALRALWLYACRYPDQWPAIVTYLRDVVFQGPRFAPNLLGFVELLGQRSETLRLSHRIVVTVARTLSAPSRTPQRLGFFLPLLERLVASVVLDPRPLLTTLLLYVRCEDVCTSGDWRRGCDILGVCRSAMLGHDIGLTGDILKNIFAAVAHFYADTDIRDRAAVYYQLVTHVFGDKLVRILTGAGVGEKGPHMDTLACLDSPIRSFKPVTVFCPQFLELVPGVSAGRACAFGAFGRARGCRRRQIFSTEVNFRDILHPLERLSENYRKAIARKERSWGIHLPLVLQYRDICRPSADACTARGAAQSSKYEMLDSPIPSEVFGLELHLTLPPHISGSPGPIYVPSVTGCADIENTVVCASVPLELDLSVQQWTPCEVQVMGEFTDPFGRTCVTEVSPVMIHIEDMFLPAPVPDQKELSLSREGNSRDFIFCLLWCCVLRHSGNGWVEGAESVRCFATEGRRVLERLQDGLSDFQVGNVMCLGDLECRSICPHGDELVDCVTSPSSLTSEMFGLDAVGLREARFLMFLPPFQHILLMAFADDDRAVIHCRTDSCELLEHLDECLDRLCTTTV